MVCSKDGCGTSLVNKELSKPGWEVIEAHCPACDTLIDTTLINKYLETRHGR